MFIDAVLLSLLDAPKQSARQLGARAALRLPRVRGRGGRAQPYDEDGVESIKFSTVGELVQWRSSSARRNVAGNRSSCAVDSQEYLSGELEEVTALNAAGEFQRRC